MAGLKFRVLLDTSQNQEIFRDIVVNEDDTFEDLYNEIIRSFQFQGNQMASFYVSNDEWDKGHEISWMDLSYDEGQMHPPSVMGSTKISEFLEEPDQKFILVYDFMRMWIFLIELISTNEESVVAPATVLAIGDSPDEHSKQATNMDFEDDFIDEEEEEDDFGFDDYDNGIDEDEIGGFDEYEY